jgi:TetR/AcrR family tetracycline transcriptional repressor
VARAAAGDDVGPAQSNTQSAISRKKEPVPDAPLTPAAIADEAIALMNEEGLEGVSLRRLADRLGIKAPSLYWHFADKSALLAAMAERIFNAGMDSVPPHRDWQQWMRAFGQAMWRAQAGTRDYPRLYATTNISPAQLDRTIGRIRDAIAHINLEEGEAMRIQSCVQALVMGWSVYAQAPYAGKLAETLDFESLVSENLELLLAGEAVKLAARTRVPAGGAELEVED